MTAGARLGVRLGLGAGVLILSSALFGAFAHELMTGQRLLRLDIELAGWLHRHATPGLTLAMLAITHLHSTIAVGIYGGVAAARLSMRRGWRALLMLAISLGGVLILNGVMKLVFHRARPVFDEPILTLSTYSFPSGHVAGSTVGYGLLMVWLFSATRSVGLRCLGLTGAALAITLVAFTRMYLGVHYFSDVIAAFAEGVAWLTLCVCAVEAYWRHRGWTGRRSTLPHGASRSGS